MNMAITKISKERVKKAVSQFFSDLEWIFDYQNFDRGIIFKEENFEDTAAAVDIDSEYRRVTMKIFPSFFDHKIYDQRDILLHEFCHTFTHEVHQGALRLLNGKFESADKLASRNEEATSRITQIIGALLKGKMKYARRGYKDYIKNAEPRKISKKRTKKH